MTISGATCDACDKPIKKEGKVWTIMHTMETKIKGNPKIIRGDLEKIFCVSCVNVITAETMKVAEAGPIKDPRKPYVSCGDCRKKIIGTDIYYHLFAVRREVADPEKVFFHNCYPLHLWCYECGQKNDGKHVFKEKVSEILEYKWSPKCNAVKPYSPGGWARLRTPINEVETLFLTILGWNRDKNKGTMTGRIDLKEFREHEAIHPR